MGTRDSVSRFDPSWYLVLSGGILSAVYVFDPCCSGLSDLWELLLFL